MLFFFSRAFRMRREQSARRIPVASDVQTTVQRTIVQGDDDTVVSEISSEQYGYGGWTWPGLPYDRRLDLMPKKYSSNSALKKHGC